MVNEFGLSLQGICSVFQPGVGIMDEKCLCVTMCALLTLDPWPAFVFGTQLVGGLMERKTEVACFPLLLD